MCIFFKADQRILTFCILAFSSNGSLGSRIDEERSGYDRNVIADTRESLNFERTLLEAFSGHACLRASFPSQKDNLLFLVVGITQG